MTTSAEEWFERWMWKGSVSSFIQISLRIIWHSFVL